jgi:hypothetical protein
MIASLLCASPALAWNGFGHMTVAAGHPPGISQLAAEVPETYSETRQMPETYSRTRQMAAVKR